MRDHLSNTIDLDNPDKLQLTTNRILARKLHYGDIGSGNLVESQHRDGCQMLQPLLLRPTLKNTVQSRSRSCHVASSLDQVPGTWYTWPGLGYKTTWIAMWSSRMWQRHQLHWLEVTSIALKPFWSVQIHFLGSWSCNCPAKTESSKRSLFLAKHVKKQVLETTTAAFFLDTHIPILPCPQVFECAAVCWMVLYQNGWSPAQDLPYSKSETHYSLQPTIG